jgi:hypothetical protein
MDTLLLELDDWDLCLDASRNIALAKAPYSIAQDVASAIKTFLGEVYYDTTMGVPYFSKIFGKIPPVGVFQEYMIAAALTVPTVVSATCVVSSFENRTVTGQVQFTDSSGTTGAVGF